MIRFPFKKIIACAMALVFSWNQILVAGDFVSPDPDPLQPVTEAAQESETAGNQAVSETEAVPTSEQFLAGESPLTPASEESSELTPLDVLASSRAGENWKVKINQGDLESVESTLGRLENAAFNESGNLEEGTFTDAGGNIYIVSEGEMIKRIRPDGAKEFYENGLIVKTEDAQGNIKTYEREIAADGSIESLTITYGENVPLPPPSKLQEEASDSSTSMRIASGSDYVGSAQSVRFDTAIAVTSLEFWLNRYHDPAGFVAARIYKDVNGALGELLAKSRLRNVQEFARSDTNNRSGGVWQVFDFEEPLELEAGQAYWIAVEIEPGFATFGSSSDYLLSYVNGSGTYSGGQAARFKESHNLSTLSGDMDFRINGYEGGIPGPPREIYTVTSNGELTDETGVIVTTQTVGDKSGFTVSITLPDSLISLADSYRAVQAHSYQLVSSDQVDFRDYGMFFKIDDQTFQSRVQLQAGWNNAMAVYTDEAGNRASFSWDIYSDTFPPKVQQVSETVTHSSAAELAYLVDGVLQKEKVYLKAGRNVLLRNFENPWGKTPMEFILDFEPVLEDGTILRYRNGVLREIEKDGLLVQNIDLTEAGDLESARVVLPDGVQMDVQNGQVTEIHSPDGRIRQFADSWILKDLRPEALPLFFSRILDSAGNVQTLSVQEGETIPLPPAITLYSVYSNNSQTASVGDDGYQARYQSIKYSQDMTLQKIDFWITRVRDPQGLIGVKIYKDNGGVPGEAVAFSLKRDVQEFLRTESSSFSGGSWQSFAFGEPVELPADVTYWISLEADPENYPTLGDSRNYVLTYRDDSNPYTGGIAARRSISGSFSKQSGGDLNMRLHGFWGNVPKPLVTNYSVDSSGNLIGADGQSLTSAYVPYQEGYTLGTNPAAQSLREGVDISAVLGHAAAYQFPPDPLVAKLLSSPMTNQSDYTLRYESGGTIY
ncbi:MAG TPA: hypothetical protein VD913_02560, partial [bacterium]|nr:hypothetical protein [bacterium]